METIAAVSATLRDGDQPLDSRFRALFALKGLAVGHAKISVIDSIASAFADNDSALLKHELAYVLGQIQDEHAVATLERVLADETEHPMVRHEAAEAMGAISSPKALPILRRYLNDGNVSVRETCELALRKIEFDQGHGGAANGKAEEAEGAALERAKQAVGGLDEDTVEGEFLPIDPAPAHSKKVDTLLASITTYRQQLTSGDKLPLFERYRAMFSLRNAVHAARRRSQRPGIPLEERQHLQELASDAIKALAAGLSDGSALFRHEICFVFGELAHPACVESMIHTLNDAKEEEMVRHEAAEALGAVVEEGSEAEEAGEKQNIVMNALKRWAGDQNAPRVVRESCIVALDEMAYNNDPSQFQPIAAT